jgi:hypothetical protein
VEGLCEQPAAGTYWVDSVEGQLSYYDPGGERGVGGEWRPIIYASDAWYAEPGVHEYTLESGWQPVSGADFASLDEFLQTYDPAPAVPE